MTRPACIAAVLAASCTIVALTPAGADARTGEALARPTASEGAATCVLHSLPAFIAQGEFGAAGTVADVVEVECNPEIYGTKAKLQISDEQLFLRCEKTLTWYVPNSPLEGFRREAGRSVTVELDPDGNATVALRAGPNCTAGDTLMTAHMQQVPFESFTTSFGVLPPQPSASGVTALPASQVEDMYSSAFATIVQAEFPGVEAEQTVRFASEELYHRCRQAPHLRWIESNGTEHEGISELTGVRLDNDGNAFVIVVGDSSCASGRSLIEADLEASPFTTLTTYFTTQSPQPTAEPAFTVEKLQEIEGSGSGLTAAPLRALLGQTVDYQVNVTNTGRVPETLTSISDPNCDAGTLVGGPGSNPLVPGESTTYACDHVLTAVGTYTNQATATAITVGGRPLTLTSNQVVVEVPEKSEMTIEKSQRIAGSSGPFTQSRLIASSGQAVGYQIVVHNTGNVPLTLSEFRDEHCDSGTLAGGPGQTPLAIGGSTTYTCSHTLGGPGTYPNQATVTATGPSGSSMSKPSNVVEASVPARAAFTIEKLQRVAQLPGVFTKLLLGGVPKGDTLDYEIIVKNTGSLGLTFAGFTDAHCDAGTIAGGPGGAVIEPGVSTTYTCSHVLGEEREWTNEASITGSAPSEPPISEVSNQVVAKAGTAGCKVSLKLSGASGPKRGPFSARVITSGEARVTIYIDGRKLEMLRTSPAKTTRLEVRIDPRRLAYGGHRVMARAAGNLECGPVARSQVFVLEHPHHPKPAG
jgi:hypothetical protein